MSQPTLKNVHDADPAPCSPECTRYEHVPLTPERMPITLAEQRVHIAKVDFVFKLLMQFASNPMFAAYFPPDMQAEMKGMLAE